MKNLTQFIKEAYDIVEVSSIDKLDNKSLYESTLETLPEEYYINEGIIDFFKNLWGKMKSMYTNKAVDNLNKIDNPKLRNGMAVTAGISSELKDKEVQKEIKDTLDNSESEDDYEKSLIKIGKKTLENLPDNPSFPLSIAATLNEFDSKEAKTLAKKLDEAIKEKYEDKEIKKSAAGIKKTSEKIQSELFKGNEKRTKTEGKKARLGLGKTEEDTAPTTDEQQKNAIRNVMLDNEDLFKILVNDSGVKANKLLQIINNFILETLKEKDSSDKQTVYKWKDTNIIENLSDEVLVKSIAYIITGLEMFPNDKLREEVISELIDHFKDITKNLEDKK